MSWPPGIRASRSSWLPMAAWSAVFFATRWRSRCEAPRRFEFVNAGINVFAHEEGNWMLLTWGDVSHLAPGAASEGDDP